MADAVDIRPYSAEDEHACQVLEARASHQAPAWTRPLLDMKFINFRSFDARVRQFECGGRALVAVSRATGQLVGTVCVSAKEVFLDGRPVTVAYLFDLRVAPESRRLGLGKRLSLEAEQLAKNNFGAGIVYLTVNEDNGPARRLYDALGYSVGSVRGPSCVPLMRLRGKPLAPGLPPCELLHGAEAASALSSGLAGSDGALRDFGSLARDENFIGVLRCREGGAEAGVGLWNSSAISGFAVKRLLVPASWYFSTGARAAGAVAAAAAGLLWLYAIWGLWLEARPAGALAAAAGLGGALAALWAMWPFLRLARLMLLQSLHEEPVCKLRGRVFAPWATGDGGDRLLGSVVARADHALAGQGFAMRVCNIAADHPSRGELGTSSFKTLLLQKRLGAGQGDSGSATAPAEWQPAYVHDPRDI